MQQSPQEMKNHRSFEMDLVGPAVPLLRRYVSEGRDVLAEGNDNQARELWLADTGKPYALGYLSTRIKDLSNRLFGKPVAIHFFRDAVTTSLVRASTELARAPKAILGHSDFRTSERHYNQATAIETGRSFGDMLKRMKTGE
jgi:site-specific recombinase XerD